MNEFKHRGIVEGYYGAAYTHEDRLELINLMGLWGLNRYLYAPKDDPLHREHWRDNYPQQSLDEFKALIEAGAKAGVQVGFAVSPGLSIRYADPEDRDALLRKFKSFRDLGSRFFALTLDDVPSTLQYQEDIEAFESLAHAHVSLAHAVAGALGEETTLWFVPTDYVGTESSHYLETLGSLLAKEIEVGWTGRTVVSPTITAAEAQARAEVLQRRLLIWDNVPVSDGPMRPMLHLGTYTGRDPELADHASGIMLNPMELPHASRLTLRTAADYLNDPGGHDATTAWRKASDTLGFGAVDAFKLFAKAHCFSVLEPTNRDIELEASFDEVRALAADSPATLGAISKLQNLLTPRYEAAAELRANLADRTLVKEIEPWLESYEIECLRMRIAVDLLEALADGINAMDAFLAFSRFEGRLTHHSRPAKASFGPRRVMYPQLLSHEDDDARFGDDEALFLDCCLADDVVRFAETRACEQLGAKVKVGVAHR
ncbi:MAG: hyaluronoglucosaminidase [Myxococcota bacterium]|jgi:hyaluronoglucosaminidase